MPVYRQTYRSYEGRVRRHFRWLVVLGQEWRVLADARPFRYLTLLAMLHALLRLLFIIGVSTVDRETLVSRYLDVMGLASVSQSVLYSFIQMQSSLAFIIMLYAGSGLVCNDLQNNLPEVYFAKPLTWRDYLAGKVATLLAAGLLVTALPACVMVAAHNALAADMQVLRDTWWWAPASVAFSAVIVVPAALTILASSALVKSQRFAAVAVFMLLIASSAMGTRAFTMWSKVENAVLSVPIAINRLGEVILGVHGRTYNVNWLTCALLLGLLSAGALAVLAWKVRRAEMAS